MNNNPGQMAQYKPVPQTPTEESSLVTLTEQKTLDIFGSIAGYKDAASIATALAKSTLIPKHYQDNVSNVLVAMEMATRIGTSLHMVMWNLNVIQGKPSWSAQFVIAGVNISRRFTSLRFTLEKLGEKTVTYTNTYYVNNQKQRQVAQATIFDMSCIAYAHDLKSGQMLESPVVTVEMAVKEGWYSKEGSKWQTMPELMLRYRAATFFGRLYCPEIFMGFQTEHEIEDATFTEIPQPAITAAPEVQPEAKPEEPKQTTPRARVRVTKTTAEETTPTPATTADEIGDASPGTAPEQPVQETLQQENASIRRLQEEAKNESAGLADAEMIIEFLNASATIEEFNENKQKIIPSYNALSKADKDTVIVAIEKLKKTLGATQQ